ncbi:hypothetical protein C1C30_004499 [Salmonella enterica subsp. enterica serovar Bredeney]|nr:hypothetical protein [Salmonella enterica]EBV6766185.1 hypothetical protein [Salmonella enterica subsp. enterica serovar Bredeney]EFB2764333.1 hypothetical protein [Escherichia coli]EBV6841565.1 hypothetical protein [Salmonella enterica subsp. enterica serovar Bredeney]EBX1146653.1 hypothetical protein [Salmonella enterica subsp. enterica serovar Bredeney]
MGSCAAPSAKGDDKFITTDYLQQCRHGSTSKTPSYTKSVSWHHYPGREGKSSVTNYPQDRVTNCPQFWLHYRLQPKKL